MAPPVAAMPLYVKTHSQGEYIFDHGWAEALRAGGRQLLSQAADRRALHPRHRAPLSGRRNLRETLGASRHRPDRQNGLSSLHITFCTAEEAEALAGDEGTLHRVTQQFHWVNHGYAISTISWPQLSSRKRKMIRKERETPVPQGLRSAP